MYINVYEIKCEASALLFRSVDIRLWNFVHRLNENLPDALQLRNKSYFVDANYIKPNEQSKQPSVISYSAFWTHQIGEFSCFSNDQIYDCSRLNCVTLKMVWDVDINTHTVTDDLYRLSLIFKGNFPGDKPVVINSVVGVNPDNETDFFGSETTSKLLSAILAV